MIRKEGTKLMVGVNARVLSRNFWSNCEAAKQAAK